MTAENRGIAILNVDDDEAKRYVASRLLKEAGFTVIEAATGEECLRIVREMPPHLVVLDVNLPDIPGFEVCRRIKSDPRTASVLVLHLSASFTGTADRVQGLECGADGYLVESVEPSEFLATVRSLIRIRRAEEDARRLAAEWQATFDSMEDGVCLLDGDGTVLRANESMCSIPGGILVGSRVPGMDAAEGLGGAVGRVLARTRETGRTCTEEVRLGGRWLRFSVHPIASDRGLPEGFVGIVTDFTARERAEEAQRESEKRFRTMVDAIPQLAWIARADGWILWYNRRWYEYTGTTPERMEGWGWQSVHDPRTLPAVMERWTASIASGEPFDMTFPLRGADGVFRPFLTRIVPFKDDDGRVVQWFGTNTDVSEQKATEEALVRAKAEADRANRAKDEFFAMLSHELRTPLSPVLMAATLMEEDTDLPERLRDDARMMRRNIDLEARLIDDMLDATRIVRGKMSLVKRLVDGPEVLRHAIETCASEAAEKGVELREEVTAERGKAFVLADPARLQQVFWNLLKNAIKFTPTGGRVTVRCAERGDRALVFEVEDTGRGIPPEVIPHLFAAFEQGGPETTAKYGGLGLGLAISKGLVELHGGSIGAASRGEGMGATFTVVLPTADAPPPSDQARALLPISRAGGASRPLSILLVEDHPSTARILERLLGNHGYRVTIAGSVAEAVSAYGRDAFEILICDVGLPDGNGYELLEMLAAIRPIAAIALTGYGMEDDLARSKAAGFLEHLTKPVSVPRLQEAIARITRRSVLEGMPEASR